MKLPPSSSLAKVTAMSGDTGRKGGEGSIFGSAIADFAMVCTKAAMDGAGSVRSWIPTP